MAKDNILPLIFGVKSTALSDEEIKFFQNNPVQGIILFSRNIESKEQVIALNQSIKNLYKDKPNLPIFVDQEGGRVARIKPPIAAKKYPTAKYFADLYLQDKDKALLETHNNYRDIMQEASNLGFDSLCSPVCDLLFDGASNIIGDRSFGRSPQQVTGLAGAAIDGILEAGGIPFIKHIPGHGRALVDSHYELPHVDEPLDELEKTDFVPFKQLAEKETWGMTAHIVYTAIDAKAPLTLSKSGIEYIRKNIFDGIIVSDDVGMFALHGELGTKKALLKRLDAAAKKNTDWAEPYKLNHSELFNKTFDVSINSMSENDLLELCHQKEAEIKKDFLASLANVSKLSIESGCNYVLHCSGDLEEMQAITAVFNGEQV